MNENLIVELISTRYNSSLIKIWQLRFSSVDLLLISSHLDSIRFGNRFIRLVRLRPFIKDTPHYIVEDTMFKI